MDWESGGAIIIGILGICLIIIMLTGAFLIGATIATSLGITGFGWWCVTFVIFLIIMGLLKLGRDKL